MVPGAVVVEVLFEDAAVEKPGHEEDIAMAGNGELHPLAVMDGRYEKVRRHHQEKGVAQPEQRQVDLFEDLPLSAKGKHRSTTQDKQGGDEEMGIVNPDRQYKQHRDQDPFEERHPPGEKKECEAQDHHGGENVGNELPGVD